MKHRPPTVTTRCGVIALVHDPVVIQRILEQLELRNPEPMQRGRRRTPMRLTGLIKPGYQWSTSPFPTSLERCHRWRSCRRQDAGCRVVFANASRYSVPSSSPYTG
jgi:hypothetical protein